MMPLIDALTMFTVFLRLRGLPGLGNPCEGTSVIPEEYDQLLLELVKHALHVLTKGVYGILEIEVFAHINSPHSSEKYLMVIITAKAWLGH